MVGNWVLKCNTESNQSENTESSLLMLNLIKTECHEAEPELCFKGCIRLLKLLLYKITQ